MGWRQRRWGGHSFGEVVKAALGGGADWFGGVAPDCVCGVGRRWRRSRAGAMPGSMLAVMMPLEDVGRSLWPARSWKLIVANKNSPEQAVLSGRTGEIERAAKTLEGAWGAGVRKLAVSAAFHSELVAGAEGIVAGRIEEACRLGRGAVAGVCECDGGGVYPENAVKAAGLLASQLGAAGGVCPANRSDVCGWGA